MTGVALAVLALVALAVSGGKNYDEACEKIISKAKEATHLWNQGKKAQAEEASEKVVEFYQEAVRLNKHGAQAHLNMGTFSLNSNRFSDAIARFELVKESPEARSSPSLLAKLESMVRRAHFGRLSMQRDQIYSKGTGDLMRTVAVAQEQLKYSPHAFRTLHELATLEAMLCEYEYDWCQKAFEHFVEAKDESAKTFAQVQKGTRGASSSCEGRIHAGLWSVFRGADSMNLVKGMELTKISDKLSIVGSDGFVLFASPRDACIALSPAPDLYPDASANVLPERSQNTRILKGKNVVSLIGFSYSTFYHWMAEALAKLVILSSHVSKSDEIVILVPKLGKRTQFISDSLTMVKREMDHNFVVVELDGKVNLRDSTLFSVNWRSQPCPTGARSSGIVGRCPALSHPQALRSLNAFLGRAIENGPFSVIATSSGVRMSTPLVVVASRGDNVAMRRGDEDGLLSQLKAVFETRGIAARFELATGGLLEEQLATYRAASVIIGIHGGALTNIVACRRGTLLVEVGFRADAAQHYAHIADAIGLRYHRVTVREDALFRSLGSPTVDFDAKSVAEVAASHFEAANREDL